ncbi:transmembrane protein, putative (macronuclear) [Tetrahymena thermophila SB210]|uniref:Transmembrane protein, putative n=1 Tax=Tetrahymena thermophila (strain SB210) TaxID=312017 RepID=I7M755_TETTS|nr:transmembrane protein, putative [Tetrahymena thermophila SB210]EAR89885.1 transmembrane protein, putative [Tetrahymena thermophila SB210]|eukprot:XP_001010130.1 transmembrane protein, putative [Tetrahymena thermophila SB210]
MIIYLNALIIILFILKLSFQFDYICDDIKPTNVYCDQNQICQDCLNADCLYCKSDLNTCTQCVSKFLLNDQCLNVQPIGAFCDKSTKICTKCSVDSCNQCSDDAQICQKCDQSSTKIYLYQNSCLNSTPDYVQCDSSNICTNKPPTYCTENCQTCDYKQKVCLQCSNTYYKVINQSSTFPTCQSNCPSNSSQQDSECYVCLEGYVYSNKNCVQQFKKYDSEIFTEDKVKEVAQQVSTSSQATTISTVALNSVSNVFSSSSFSIVTAGLSCQKLSYLTIVDCNLPNPVFQPLNAQKGNQLIYQLKCLK